EYNMLIKSSRTKQRRDDLTCVICKGSAYCHNFGQISCHSCKGIYLYLIELYQLLISF
ncbi:unnamed protein product, partial [Rotaria sp. Silwood2]